MNDTLAKKILKQIFKKNIFFKNYKVEIYKQKEYIEVIFRKKQSIIVLELLKEKEPSQNLTLEKSIQLFDKISNKEILPQIEIYILTLYQLESSNEVTERNNQLHKINQKCSPYIQIFIKDREYIVKNKNANRKWKVIEKTMSCFDNL